MLQEQKKSKEPTHLIKHDFEVIKPSGKTGKLIKVEYWDRSFQMSELLVQKTETDKCTHSYLLLWQERLLLCWISGRAEVLQRFWEKLWMWMSAAGRAAHGRRCQAAPVKLAHPRGTKPACDIRQVQKHNSAALPLLLVPWRGEKKPIVQRRLKCWAIIFLSRCLFPSWLCFCARDNVGNIHCETLAAGGSLGGFSAHWQRENTSFTPPHMPYQRNKEQSSAFSRHTLARSVL